MNDALARKLLLQGIYEKYGYDFTGYNESSFTRRIEGLLTKYGLPDELELMARILRDPRFFAELVPQLTVSTTELFRDPSFFLSFREKVVPMLKTYPALNFWIAGCSTGEEVYSLAILLQEEGLYERSLIYATDINHNSLKTASEGIYSVESMRAFAKNYTAAGGKESPSEYYTADYNLARFRSSLRDHVVFSDHNLATDESFLEHNVIFCRNVMIYFNRELQGRVFDLFYNSLSDRGFLGLGSKETLRFSQHNESFDEIDAGQRIYQKNPMQVAKKMRKV
ncbi:chemotaxis protein CheR [Bdellovibrio bacteriovorus]|uniref:Chemotaxis protein CheR n=1 Tax=Bdellovibrio bacteriovorus TaxID=959 RepID=A0A150WI23_BDEBC|nr:protein-glutamate O-methyltransferase CheR [Bdellovibrio bacteriovorus]KYG63248.1 chemotaxis protein CheR [Bdellovibrio bacteriovorus]